MPHCACIEKQFRVFGVVVDKKMLARLGSTMGSLLVTAVPFVFGLRPDLNEEFTHNTTDTTQEQLQLIHENMVAQQHQLATLRQQLGALQQFVNNTCS